MLVSITVSCQMWPPAPSALAPSREKLALQGGFARGSIDNTMIKAIARAFRWQKLLENGTYGCLEEIARAEKIGGSFVSRVVRLALLAPDIVEAILAGKQPARLTLKDLMLPFPVEWKLQRTHLYRLPPSTQSTLKPRMAGA